MPHPLQNEQYQQFKKMGHHLNRSSKISTNQLLAQIEEDLKYYKKKIIELCKTNNETELQKVIEKVIKLFAQQTALELQQSKELLGEISVDDHNESIAQYGMRCAVFLDTIEQLQHAYA